MAKVLGWAIAGLAAGAVAVGLWWWLTVRNAPWPAWEAFAEGFVQADGRVVDHTAGGRTVSEGQAYAAFFALVANDPLRFDRIIEWTQNNLSAGSFATQLPAWLWGEKDDGSWGVKDANAASDADLWLAYALFEASRLWAVPRYHAMAQDLLAQVKAKEIVELPGVGLMLIPAPQGFQRDDGHWRLNPSYLPEFQLRYFQHQDPDGPWSSVWGNFLSLMQPYRQQGLVPDWFEVAPSGQPVPCRVTGHLGSYDAIRSYLWAAMTPAEAEGQGLMPLVAQARSTLRRGVADGSLEKIDVMTGETQGPMPLGFAAALLPYFSALDDDESVAALEARLKDHRHHGLLGRPPHYYDQVLALFGEGHHDQRFSFDGLGRLNTRWAH